MKVLVACEESQGEKKGVKILSLFDGMACGMIAMQLAGVEVESYDAYEIDKYAIKTAQHNFPMIKEHGDVFGADFTQYEGVDFLIGGSPCTYWSIAQTKNRETVASGMGWELFSQYVRALHEAKPKYFIYENNKSMSKQIRESIDKAFGFEAVLINSALVSAQNRQRLYWVGKRNEDGTYSKVPVEQPEDRGILLRDVLDDGAVTWKEKAYTLRASAGTKQGISNILRHIETNGQFGYMGVVEPINTDANEKAFCVTARYYKGFGNNPGKCLEKHRDSMIAEPICLRYERTEEAKRCRKAYEAHEIKHGYNELNELHPRPDGKTNTLTTVLKDNQIMEPIGIKHLGSLYGQHSRWGVFDEEGKAPTLTASAGMGGGHLPMVKEAVQVGAMPRPDGEISTSAGFRIYSTEAKGRYLCANGGGAGAKTGLYAISYSIEFDDDGRPVKAIGKDGKEITIYEVKDGKITIKGKQYPIKLKDGYYIIRKLTVSECKRLQTVPEWYEFPVSNSQAYKLLGNGWTCEVIRHLINSCFKPADALPGQIEMEVY